MPRQIEVLAEDIGRDDQGRPTELTGTTRILTYKSFQYLNANPEAPRYRLLYEVDEMGKEVPGSPNLSAQHKQELPQRNVGLVVDTGPTDREKELMAEIAKLKAASSVTDAVKYSGTTSEIVTEPNSFEQRRPGRPKKQTEEIA